MNVTDLINYALSKFPKYDAIKYNFNFDYNKTPKNETWKIIPDFNYECSNFGRIRNITTKKTKTIKSKSIWKSSCIMEKFKRIYIYDI